jgi:hypothetical protein
MSRNVASPTATIGNARRCSFTASRNLVNSFAAASSFFRAVIHVRDATWGTAMATPLVYAPHLYRSPGVRRELITRSYAFGRLSLSDQPAVFALATSCRSPVTLSAMFITE